MVGNATPANIGATTDWYIIRKDMLRAPQAKNIVYVNWRPPIGIMKHTEYLGSGDYLLTLQPNGQYLTSCVETKNTDLTPGAAIPYSLLVNSVRLYVYVEKVQIPPSVQELHMMEYQVQSKPWQPTLQFIVSPFTEALTFFIQDNQASYSPLVPPSMFKCYNNDDLSLRQIQCSYGGFTKPSTPWESNFYGTTNATFDGFQQRYMSSYEESGQSLAVLGCETYSDFLIRGPFYHFTFTRDKSYRATDVSLNTVFNGLANGPSAEVPRTYIVSPITAPRLRSQLRPVGLSRPIF